MDIIVTIPKSEDYEEWLKECLKVAEEPTARLNYRIGDIPFPKKAKKGDKCWVVYEGFIRGYHIISGFETRKDSFKCLTTGKEYEPGNYIVRKGQFYFTPVIKKKGFQGYQYFEKKVSLEVTLPSLNVYPIVDGHRPFWLGDALIGEITETELNEDGQYDITVEFWSKRILDKFLKVHRNMNENEVVQ